MDTRVQKRLSDFWPDVLKNHYRAQRKKASTISAAETIYDRHLGPALGTKPLLEIRDADVAALKGELSEHKPKTVNNVLSVLGRIRKCALKWHVVDAWPLNLDLLKVAPAEYEWYEVHDYRRLVDGARKCGNENLLVVLLGGSAGLRLGEIRELAWSDVDLTRRQLRITRNRWHDEVDAPKGWRARVVPITGELHAALKAQRPATALLGHVLPELSIQTVRTRVEQAQRRSGLPETAGVHALRHTYGSHLAIAGVPAKTIQELMGHSDLKTTLRYMHLSPANRSAAVEALAGLYAGDASAKERVG